MPRPAGGGGGQLPQLSLKERENRLRLNPLIQRNIKKYKAVQGKLFDSKEYIKRLALKQAESIASNAAESSTNATSGGAGGGVAAEYKPLTSAKWFRSNVVMPLHQPSLPDGITQCKYTEEALQLLQAISETMLKELCQQQLQEAISEHMQTILPRHAIRAVQNNAKFKDVVHMRHTFLDEEGTDLLYSTDIHNKPAAARRPPPTRIKKEKK